MIRDLGPGGAIKVLKIDYLTANSTNATIIWIYGTPYKFIRFTYVPFNR